MQKPEMEIDGKLLKQKDYLLIINNVKHGGC